MLHLIDIARRARVAVIIFAISAGLAGCASTVSAPTPYSSCYPGASYTLASGGTISAQQAGAGRSIQWGVYPQISGATYHVIVYTGGKKYDEKTQSYPPHGSVDGATATKYAGKLFQISGKATKGNDVLTFNFGCNIK